MWKLRLKIFFFHKEWFYHAFKELAEKWAKTIERGGLYVEY
jgi:hypothetical protein